MPWASHELPAGFTLKAALGVKLAPFLSIRPDPQRDGLPRPERPPARLARAMEPERLKSMIEAAIPGALVTVRDLTGTRDHFGVQVESTAFAGKSLVEQHQMVYRAVGKDLTNAVHALQVHTVVPEE
jgi:stress-induced morphogen